MHQERSAPAFDVGRLDRRLRSLDGLRGLAAVVVLLHHSALVTPGLAASYLPGERAVGAAAVLTYTPLHVVWAGTEAVYLFFILSGYVLTRWWLDGRRALFGYYPQRLLRLYLPVWASLGLAAALAMAVSRTHLEGQSFWIVSQSVGYDWSSFWGDLTLNEPSNLNNPLWSLRYEVIFSLLLPVYASVARRSSAVWLPLAAGAVMASAVGFHEHSRVGTFLPMFAIGSLLAVRPSPDETVDLRATTWWGLAGVAVLLTTAASWLGLPGPGGVASALVGAALLVWMFITCPALRRWGHTRLAAWLGSRSFSLYLTHVPILATVAYVMPSGPRALPAAIGLILAPPVAEAFHRCVEAPCHTFANSVGRRLAAGN